MSFYSFCRAVGGTFFRIVFPFKVYGAQNIYGGGNLVVISNHLSAIDVPTLALLYKDKTYFLAKKEWFNNKLYAWLFGKLGGIPVDRENTDLQSARACLTVLKKNGRLCIFPEGTRNKTEAELLPFHAGAGLFAFRSKSVIQPVIILKKPRAFKKTKVFVGEPFDFSQFYDKKADSNLNEKLLEKMRQEMLSAQAELKKAVSAEKQKKLKNERKAKRR